MKAWGIALDEHLSGNRPMGKQYEQSRSSEVFNYFRNYRSSEVACLVAKNHPEANVRFSILCVNSTSRREMAQDKDRNSNLEAWRLKQACISHPSNKIDRNKSAFVDDVISQLKTILKTFRSINLKEDIENRGLKKNQEFEISAFEVESLSYDLSKSGNIKELLWRCLRSSKQSQVLSRLMDVLDVAEIERLAGVISPGDLMDLASIPKSIFFFVKLKNRLPWFDMQSLQGCKDLFWQLISNRMTSKLVIHYIETSPDFRQFVFKTSKKYLNEVTKNFSATYILTIAIKHAASDSEYAFVARKLAKDGYKVLHSRYFKRLLVSYAEYCGPTSLQHLFDLLDVSHHIVDYFRDKYMTYLLLMFLKRAHQPFIQMVSNIISRQLEFFRETRYFCFFLLKSVTIKHSPTRQTLNKALLSIDPHLFTGSLRYNSFFYLYCYLSLITAAHDEQPSVVDRLERQFSILLELGMKTSSYT